MYFFNSIALPEHNIVPFSLILSPARILVVFLPYTYVCMCLHAHVDVKIMYKTVCILSIWQLTVFL